MAKKVIARIFNCWRCEGQHEFQRSTKPSSIKIGSQKKYSNHAYFWVAFNGDCPAGGASFTGFDPEETLKRK